MIRLREAGPGESPVLHDLMQAFNAEQGVPWHEGMAEAMDRLLSDPTLGRAWLVESEGETAGYVVLCFGFSLEFRGRDAFVDELYLKPAFRGLGLGRAALDLLLPEARRAGIRALHLEVAHGEPRLLKLYGSVGFRERPHPFWTLLLEP